MRTAAIIEDTEVTNLIVLADGAQGDETLEYYESRGVLCVEITDMEPMPGIGNGWTYVDRKWIGPPSDPLDE